MGGGSVMKISWLLFLSAHEEGYEEEYQREVGQEIPCVVDDFEEISHFVVSLIGDHITYGARDGESNIAYQKPYCGGGGGDF
jgi:hypothetical protein